MIVIVIAVLVDEFFIMQQVEMEILFQSSVFFKNGRCISIKVI